MRGEEGAASVARVELILAFRIVLLWKLEQLFARGGRSDATRDH